MGCDNLSGPDGWGESRRVIYRLCDFWTISSGESFESFFKDFNSLSKKKPLELVIVEIKKTLFYCKTYEYCSPCVFFSLNVY